MAVLDGPAASPLHILKLYLVAVAQGKNGRPERSCARSCLAAKLNAKTDKHTTPKTSTLRAEVLLGWHGPWECG